MAAAAARPVETVLSPIKESPPLPGFEGPEKTIEIDFVPGVGPADGLRAVTRESWDSILGHAACTILVEHRAPTIDAYVLSESSLFVMSHKLLIKTCGTTTLLLVLPEVLKAADELGLKVEWLCYSRKDFLFPKHQKFPHRSMQEEISFLRKYFPDGHAHVLGPVTRDHWFVFTADRCERPSEALTDRTLNLMMYDIAPETAACFTREGLAKADEEAAAALESALAKDVDPENPELCRKLGDRVTRKLRLHELLPGTATQAWLFEPCGWSLNGEMSFPDQADTEEAVFAAAAEASPVVTLPPDAASATAEASCASTPKSGSTPRSHEVCSGSGAYWTVHVTPEKHCSYVSFETSAPLKSHKALVRALLVLFRPRRFTLTVFADRAGLAEMTSRAHDHGASDVFTVLPSLRYARLDLCSTEFVGDYSVILGNYRLLPDGVEEPPEDDDASPGTAPALSDAELARFLKASAAATARALRGRTLSEHR